VRLFAIVLSVLIAGPSPAFAQTIRSVRIVTPPVSAGLPSVSVLPTYSPSLGLSPSPFSLTPGLSAPAVQVVPLQSAVAVSPLKPVAPVALAVKVRAAAAITPTLAKLPLHSAPAAASESFALLTGEPSALRREDSSVLAAPSIGDNPAPLQPAGPPRGPVDPAAAKSVKRLMLGTSVMKAGMETVTLSMPLLALSAFGGLSAVAGLVVIYGLAQAAFAGMSGGLAERFSARKVLAGAVALQAVLVAALVGVAAAGALSMTTMVPLYLLIGGVTGVVESTRHTIPRLLLGSDEDALETFNAKLHVWYQVAGVAGALAAGGLIALAGPAWALLLQPPAYALAAWIFWKVRHAAPAAKASALAKSSVGENVKTYFRDLKAGAKLVLGSARLRWVALAFVFPQIVHRVFENLLIPVFAKKVLEMPSASAWLLTASNLGELIGAAMLLRLASRFSGPSAWVKWGALGWRSRRA
jgi:hypothetical protein